MDSVKSISGHLPVHKGVPDFNTHTPNGVLSVHCQMQTLPALKRRDRGRDRRGWKSNESVRRHRWELKALELVDNRPRSLLSLPSPRLGFPLMFAHDTWGTGTAARTYVEKKQQKKTKTPPALSLNTWWPNQFQIPFAYRYYPQTAHMLLFSLTLKANLVNPEALADTFGSAAR